MPALLPNVDPDGLLEYSVVYTDRSLNHMSAAFGEVMRDISVTLKGVYNAQHVAIVPGSGTYGMESVARQLATDKKALVIRNGFFSYRWSQILEMGRISSNTQVLLAQKQGPNKTDPFAPAAIETVIEEIQTHKPDIVFAPHVETASGMILTDDYLKQLADAVHGVNGLLVLDCIASGAVWVDMQACGIDVLISAPQKGWSASPCCGLVMLNDEAHARVNASQSTSFAMDLKKWLDIMHAYESGGHAYHATMPTDALRIFRDVMKETAQIGFDVVRDQQWQLGRELRKVVEQAGYASVAAEGFQAPGVIVSYTDDPNIKSGQKFTQLGFQIAAGVPLMCDEADDYMSFRIGLFGLDKLGNVMETVDRFAAALNDIA